MDIRPLSGDNEVYRQEALTLAAHYLDSASPLPMEKVQELYQVVAVNWRDYDKAQIAVGIAFGETIAEKAGWEWGRNVIIAARLHGRLLPYQHDPKKDRGQRTS